MSRDLDRIDRTVNMLVGGLVALVVSACLLSVAAKVVGETVEGVVRAARCTEPVSR